MQATSTADFKELLTNTKELVVVDFFAEWCGPCQMLSPVLESLAPQYEGKLKIVKIDIDNSQDLAMEYKVVSVPTIVFLKDGQEVDRVVGFQSADSLKQKFDGLA